VGAQFWWVRTTCSSSKYESAIGSDLLEQVLEPERESDYFKNKTWNRVLGSNFVWNPSPKPKLRFRKGKKKKKKLESIANQELTSM
jgi:hypothetical protein